ncbi:hypothetical protein OAJ94_05015, partial [Deltaproteobacteria bacterium]|nr:hypothetical protein [Deltaproteobacteria bacterium]
EVKDKVEEKPEVVIKAKEKAKDKSKTKSKTEVKDKVEEKPKVVIKAKEKPKEMAGGLIENKVFLSGADGKLWPMFFFSVLLVAALNFYAVSREPDIISIAEIHEHENEVVKIEGIMISWVEDPYSDGSERLDIILQDESGVAEVRWFKFGELPTIGSKISAVGDVRQWEGRFWIQSLGNGALQWDSSDVAQPEGVPLAVIGQDPEPYMDETISIEGYITKTIHPDTVWTSAYIADHPNYANSKHQLRLFISSASGAWIEAGSKITVTGQIRFEEREFRFVMYTQGPEILVDYTVMPSISVLEWGDKDTWGYEMNKLVQIQGIPYQDENEDWWVQGPATHQRLCILPGDRLLENNASAFNDVDGLWTGRLVWLASIDDVCLDDGGDASSEPILGVEDLLVEIVSHPSSYLDDPAKQWNVTGYLAESLAPDDSSASVRDAQSWRDDKVSVYVDFPSSRSQWIEEGQRMEMVVTVDWNPQYGSMNLVAVEWELQGEALPADTLSWDSDVVIWGYSENNMVFIEGKLMPANGSGETWLIRPETNDRICAETQSLGSLNLEAMNHSQPWYGRLIEKQDIDNRSTYLCLSGASSDDSDGDGLSDWSEREVYNTDIDAVDSDSDGHEDAFEVLAGSDPDDSTSTPSET